ncbi:MAG: alkaline phosphatase D family protein [candidate division KSB1 bacterium]|nr:alkaline phosphatase D family protein [candidate division KSB1 bacterium]
MRLFCFLMLCLTINGFTQESTIQPRDKLYKKRTRDAIAMLVDGKTDSAIAYLENVRRAYKNEYENYIKEKHAIQQDDTNTFVSVSVDLQTYLKQHPEDAEALFALALAYSHKGERQKAIEYVKQAIDAGLPPGRFWAGPCNLTEKLYQNEHFHTLVPLNKNKLIHGPLVSNVTSRSAEFWMRTAIEMPVQVAIYRQGNGPDTVYSQAVTSDRDKDYTAVVRVKGLKAGTVYEYVPVIDGHIVSKPSSFRTFPPQYASGRLKVGFGGGAGYTPWNEIIWTSIASNNPNAFLLLGDNVYIDHPLYPDVQKYCYYRRQSSKAFRDFAASTPIYAIWDDHDFADNDSWGGSNIYYPKWKPKVWDIFRQNWNNPYYGGGFERPGCWFDFRIADVDFFMLDGRYYRTNPHSKNLTMLGPDQKQWLFDRLRHSDATFKVIASPVPWAFGAKPKPHHTDTWEGFSDEREEIFTFLEREKINGVVLISADRHRSDIWRIERENGYDLYDFMSSRLTNVHTHKKMPGSIYAYNEKNSFGMLTFDTTPTNPVVSYSIYNIDNEKVYEYTLEYSQLSY